MRTNSFWSLPLGVRNHHISLPSERVVTEHAAFRIASRATRVDQAARLARLLCIHFSQDDLVLYGEPSLQEVSPKEEARALYVRRQARLAPNDESLDVVVLVEINGEALEVLCGLADDHFGFGVISLVKAGVGLVGDVDARVHLVVHYAAQEGNGPLRGVEAHDCDGGTGSCVELVASFCEAHGVVPVLVPGPAQLGIVALDPKRGTIASALHGVLEHLAEGERDLRAGATLAHFDWELILYVASPVQALSSVGIH
mmetsp:Transcript_11570/g.14587  ORF Transcript_11570/g.14587 Transcript_11570/m.14587 type:complete len:256 (+) Transcript_11570:1380-2147(+)